MHSPPDLQEPAECRQFSQQTHQKQNYTHLLESKELVIGEGVFKSLGGLRGSKLGRDGVKRGWMQRDEAWAYGGV